MKLIVFGNGIFQNIKQIFRKKYQIIAYVSFKKFVKSKNFNGRPL